MSTVASGAEERRLKERRPVKKCLPVARLPSTDKYFPGNWILIRGHYPGEICYAGVESKRGIKRVLNEYAEIEFSS